MAQFGNFPNHPKPRIPSSTTSIKGGEGYEERGQTLKEKLWWRIPLRGGERGLRYWFAEELG